jgi:hypothetical protein
VRSTQWQRCFHSTHDHEEETWKWDKKHEGRTFMKSARKSLFTCFVQTNDEKDKG